MIVMTGRMKKVGAAAILTTVAGGLILLVSGGILKFATTQVMAVPLLGEKVNKLEEAHLRYEEKIDKLGQNIDNKLTELHKEIRRLRRPQ